jgi:hypothetical protein
VNRNRSARRDVLVAELRRGDVVIWDNVKPHLSAEAIEAVETAGPSEHLVPSATGRSLPPLSGTERSHWTRASPWCG